MNYAISDIHGDFESYLSILRKIAFSERDVLHVLGDVIDRGSDSVKILLDMKERCNVSPLIGNHEYTALPLLRWIYENVPDDENDIMELGKKLSDMDEAARSALIEWMNLGGSSTISEFTKISKETQKQLISYVEGFPAIRHIKAGDREFVLTHAGLKNFSRERPLEDYDINELIFEKPDYSRVYFDDKYLVTGHTPTKLIFAEASGRLLEEIPIAKHRNEIFRKNAHLAIDCGCGFGGRIGCICLETMECFYA